MGLLSPSHGRRLGVYGSLPGSNSGTPTHRRRAEKRMRVVATVAAVAAAVLLLNSGVLSPPDPALVAWSLKGCPQKILDLTTTMEDQYKAAVAAGLDPELGQPTTRKPKTAILNFVRYHTEVVAVAVFHFVKLRHNVTVFTREDPFHMGDVMHPYFWKGFRKFERFFEHFHEYDNIVVATFPTCHDPTLRELLRLRLPQRYIAMVHNPEYLNNTGIARMVADHDIRLLAISPHVGQYAREVLQAQGVEPNLDWVAPMMPVIYPEDCQPGAWQLEHPACNRSALWGGQAPPPAVLDAAQRTAFCIQGKVDPARRNYVTIFREMLEHKEELLARNFSLIILGKGGGRRDASIVRIPEELVEAGLIRQYASLPFQEYYEILHSCMAVVPAFADDAYYVNKGSSSVGASLISGVPLIAHRYMLKSYNFLEESAVFLADEPMSDVEAMLWVQSQPPEVRAAKMVGLAALRAEMYERNLQVLQSMLGERYMYHSKHRRGTWKGQYRPMYIDMSMPIKYSGPRLNSTLVDDGTDTTTDSGSAADSSWLGTLAMDAAEQQQRLSSDGAAGGEGSEPRRRMIEQGSEAADAQQQEEEQQQEQQQPEGEGRRRRRHKRQQGGQVR